MRLWLPAARFDTVQVARSPLIGRALQPETGVVPSRKSTVPVGAPALPPRIAVSVTVAPASTEFGEADPVIVGFTLFTVCVTVAVPAPYVVLPE